VIVLDASVWVSIALRRDVNRAVSRQWADQWTDAGKLFVVPTLFIAEVAGVLSRQSGRASVGRQMTSTLLASASFQHEPVDRSLAEIAARHAADLPLKGCDAIYVALAERMGIPLVTWDNEQLTRAAAVIDVRTPTI
jgi:predicted nucleic acid-binding protein